MFSKILRVLIYSIVFLVPVFFLPLTFEWLEFNKLYLFFFLTWLGILVWLLKMVIADKRIKIRYSLFDLAVGLFLGVVLISSLISVDRVSSFFGSYGRFSGSVFLYFTLAAFYFLLSNNIGNNNNNNEGIIKISGIIKTLICSGILVLFFIYLSLSGIFEGLLGGAIASPVSATNLATSVFLSIVLLLTVIAVLDGLRWGGFENQSTNSKKWEILYFTYIILGLIVLIISDITLSWLTLIFGFFLIISLVLKKRTLKQNVYKLMLPIALVIISSLFLFINTGNVLHNTFLQNSPLALREITLSQADSWQLSGRSLGSGIKSAFLGNGPSTFGYTFSKFRPETLNTRNLWPIRFSRGSSYLSELLVEVGVLGFLSYLSLLVILALFVFEIKEHLPFRKKRKILEPTDIGMNLLAIVLLAIFLGQIFYYQSITLLLLFWLFAGVVIGHKGAKQGSINSGFIKNKFFSITERPEGVLIIETFIIVIAILYVAACFFGVKFYLADIKYVQALNNPDLEQKALLLEDSIGLNPYFSRYKMVLSQVYMRMAEEKIFEAEGEDQQNKAIELVTMARAYAEISAIESPNQIIALENLANIYSRIMGIAQEKEEFANMTIDALNKASALEPKNPGIYANIGDIYFALGKNDDARSFFEKSINQIDVFSRGEVSLALILEAEDKKEEAIQKLELFVIRAPREVDALFHLGRIYYNENRINEAITTLSDVLKIDDKHANSRFALALSYERQGKKQEAIQQLKIVQELNPNIQEIKDMIERLEKGEPLIKEVIGVAEPVEEKKEISEGMELDIKKSTDPNTKESIDSEIKEPQDL